MAAEESDQSTPSSVLEGQWRKAVDRFQTCYDQLISELDGCWRDQQTLLEALLRRLDEAPSPAHRERGLLDFHAERSALAEKLLHQPISQWERRRSSWRALKAVEAYQRSLEDLVKLLPESVSVTGPQMVELLGAGSPTGLRRRLAQLRKKKRPLPLRRVVLNVVRTLSERRLRIESQYFLALAQSTRRLSSPWGVARAATDAAVRGQPIPADRFSEQREKTKNSTHTLWEKSDPILSRWRAWNTVTLTTLTNSILSAVVWRRRPKSLTSDDRRASCQAYWVAQLRAVEAEVRLELALERCEEQILKLFQQGLDSLALEHANLLAELDEAIASVRRRLEGASSEEFPPPQAEIAPAARRLAELEELVNGAMEAIPEPVETLKRLSALPPRRTKWRKLFPRRTLRQAFAGNGWPSVAAVLENIEADHRHIVQEIERAREVVAFGLEIAGAEAESNLQVAREAAENALSLLQYYRGGMQDWRPSVEPAIARIVATVFSEYRLILSRHWLGVFTSPAEQGLRRAIALIARSAASGVKIAGQKSPQVIEASIHRLLISIGWKRPPQAGRVEVTTRPFLPQELTVDLTAKELPAIYRRLFRFEPVEDPRFLVGREQEMKAMAEARHFWESGRPVALIIAGERGSGKTSLINCALKRPLEGLEVIRGEFGERLVTAAQLHGFLARLVGLDDSADLHRCLTERRRVVIIEELERTFLRQVGYFEAIRALQRLIAATCSSTLWVLSVNQVAFRFLDAAINLSATFSHRINAATATRDDLRQAVLLRHNLSGLRLNFATPPSPQGIINRLKRSLQGEPDPESIFFDALASESAGVFRSAFDIWLSHIEEVQAGVLSLRAIVVPDLSPMIEVLDLADLFTLVAILQHGSLTPEETAVIFQKSLVASRAQLDELLAREIIAADPGRTGFRIRPEAMRVVKEALYRHNLL
jgi:uncharacterized protein YukE